MRNTTALGLGAAAALLGASALLTRSQTKAITARHPPRGRFVDTPHARLHVLEAGAGTPVLLLHGNAVAANDWANAGLIDALAQTHRVIAPDRPGYGHSDRSRERRWTPQAQAQTMADLLRQMQAGPAIVVAHSIGTQVALRLALDHPDRVSRLVLVSGYYFPTLRLDALAVAPVAAPVLGDLIRSTVGPLAGRMGAAATLKAMFSPTAPPPGYERRIFEQSLRPLMMRACAADGAAMTTEAAQLEKRLSELSMPIMVLAGAEDRIVDPLSQSKRLAHEAPDAVFRLLPGVGHMLHYQNKNAVVAAVADAPQRTPNAREPAPAHP